MSEIIKLGGPVWTKRRELILFDSQDSEYGESTFGGMVAGFDVDSTGRHPLLANPAQVKTWELYAGNPRYVAEVIVSEQKHYEPTLVRCDCGRDVAMNNAWENVCTCGRGYNGFGQGIVPENPNCHCGSYYDGRDCMCFETD